MVLELAAPRLVARHLGTTALTWTVVIATFLGGLALGNAWGGRWADRARAGTLSSAFWISALAAAAAIPLDGLAASLPRGLGHAGRVLVGVPVAFLPAAILLGTLPPVLGRSLLRHDPRPGRALGALAAALAVGSVLGTVLAGFVLVPRFGTRSLFLGTAAVLALAGLLSVRRRETEAPDLPPRQPVGRRPAGRAGYAGLACLAGAAVLAVEIAAARIASDRLGNSVYTWTSVLAVVLGGLALGNLIGGRLGDRFSPRPLLGVLLLAGAVGATACLWAPDLMRVGSRLPWSWEARVFMAVATPFFVPSLLLGTISPAVIRAALREPSADGRVVGGLYAAGTVGAVAAAVLAGLLFIPFFGVTVLLLGVALTLALASARVRRRRSYVLPAMFVVAILLAWLPWTPARDLGLRLDLREDAEGIYVEDSRYSRIRVRPVELRWVQFEETPDVRELESHPILYPRVAFREGRSQLLWDASERPMKVYERAHLRKFAKTRADEDAVDLLWERTRHDVRYLTLDRLVHGYVDLQDPSWLGYEYEVLYAGILGRHWPADVEASCLFIGGGSYTFQRHLLARDDRRLRCVTAEIDPAVTRAARRVLGLVDDPRHRIVHEDARTYVNRVDRVDSSEERFHFVFGDAFDDLAVPFHLTTVEFARSLSDRMEPTGLYLVNVVDVWNSGLFRGALVTTLEEVFEHVAVTSLEPRNDDARETFVVAASHAPLDLDGILDLRGRPLAVVRYDVAEVADLRDRAGGRVLTDDHAPVEILLAPVVQTRTPEPEGR
jgi:spermidine synthase/MFS family permease